MPTVRRPPGVRVARGLLWALAAGHLVEAVALRRRLDRIPPLPVPPSPPSQTTGTAVAGARDAGERVRVVGADVDARTRRAIDDLLDAGVELVDLVPADLPASRALRLLRRVDPERLRTDPLYTPGGAHEAVALRPALAAHIGDLDGDDVDRSALARRTVRAQRYAPTSTDIRVAPALRARSAGPADRWRELEEMTAFARPHGALAPVLVGIETAHLLAMAAGLAVAAGPALAALATWSAQPCVVFGARRTPSVRPPNLVGASVVRPLTAGVDNVRTVAAGVAAGRAAARSRWSVPVAPPPDELFEPRSDRCPWCGAATLMGRLDTTDLLQHKPGRFHLDECTTCGHVFQNPALSLRGLDHYYDQFYEGEGEEPWEFAFAAMGRAYEQRADTIARFTEPRAWLDVGTGHGHFCLAARRRWPQASFDGLDLSESVEEAARRGWIDIGYRGLFPDLAGSLARSYDVLSMHHYLEHTRDPRAELTAAAKVLESGGHLMVEGPDVDCPWSRRLGRYWRCWFQPQHQHFVTCANLIAALDENGFDVVSVERGTASEGMDITSAVTFWVNRTAPDPRAVWLPPPSLAGRAKRLGVLAAAVPAVAVAALVDLVKDARLRRPGATTPGNAYRVVARRR
jgi:ubiquinone/menaquinone biosynthesis C-methylase UbiE